MTENQFLAVYLSVVGLWTISGLIWISVRTHLKREIPEEMWSFTIIGGVLWPLFAAAFVVGGCIWCGHKLIGVLIRKMFGPRIEVSEAASIEDRKYYEEANREVETLLGEVPESEMLMSGSIDQKEFVSINRIRYTMTNMPSE